MEKTLVWVFVGVAETSDGSCFCGTCDCAVWVIFQCLSSILCSVYLRSTVNLRKNALIIPVVSWVVYIA